MQRESVEAIHAEKSQAVIVLLFNQSLMTKHIYLKKNNLEIETENTVFSDTVIRGALMNWLSTDFFFLIIGIGH